MKVRFIISAGNKRVNLFSIKEVANREDKTLADLNIHFRGGARTRFGRSLAELVRPEPEEAYSSSDTHFSVHANPGRSTNTVTRRLGVNGSEHDAGSVMVTEGVKAGKFQPILFRTFGDFANPRHHLPTHSDIERDLGAYEPSTDQLRLMIIVSGENTIFPVHEEHPTNCLSQSFRGYEVTILWSFFNFPSPPHAVNIVPYSTAATGVVSGMNWAQVYNTYTDLNMAVASEQFKLMDEPGFHGGHF